MSLRAHLWLSAAALSFLVGCGQPPADLVVGTWSCGVKPNGAAENNGKLQMTYSPDGKLSASGPLAMPGTNGSITKMSLTMNGNWSLDKDTLTASAVEVGVTSATVDGQALSADQLAELSKTMKAGGGSALSGASHVVKLTKTEMVLEESETTVHCMR